MQILDEYESIESDEEGSSIEFLGVFDLRSGGNRR